MTDRRPAPTASNMKRSSPSLPRLLALSALAVPALAGCELPMTHANPAVATAEAAPLEIAVDSFAGSWSDGDLVLEIVDRGAALEVRYPNGRGPFVARRTGPGEINVDFYDDTPCCSGRLAIPDRIDWSNGGSWHRVPESRAGVGVDLRIEAASDAL